VHKSGRKTPIIMLLYLDAHFIIAQISRNFYLPISINRKLRVMAYPFSNIEAYWLMSWRVSDRITVLELIT